MPLRWHGLWRADREKIGSVFNPYDLGDHDLVAFDFAGDHHLAVDVLLGEFGIGDLIDLVVFFGYEDGGGAVLDAAVGAFALGFTGSGVTGTGTGFGCDNRETTATPPPATMRSPLSNTTGSLLRGFSLLLEFSLCLASSGGVTMTTDPAPDAVEC